MAGFLRVAASSNCKGGGHATGHFIGVNAPTEDVTMPSKAEIEAATSCMEQFMFAPHELPLADDLHQQYLQMAEQALVLAEHERWKASVDKR